MLALLLALFIPQGAAAHLSKVDAYDQLQRNGFKWLMTGTLREAAEAKRQEAESAFHPKAELAFRQFVGRINPVQYGATSTPSEIDTVGFGTSAIAVSWLVWDPLSTAELLAAQATEKMSTAQSRHYQNEITALMLVQYLNVQRLQKQLDAMEANLKKSRLILKLADSKKSIGAGIPLDVARARNLVGLDKIKKIAIFTKYLKARHDLSILLGAEKVEHDLDTLEVRRVDPRQLRHALGSSVEQRADLQAATYGLEAALKGEKETEKYFFPKLTILGEVGSTDTTILGLPGRTLNGVMGVSLTIPIEAGGLITAKRREASIERLRADLNLHQTHAEVISQVKDAMEQLLSAEEALKISADYLKTAQDEESITETRFYAGMSNTFDMTSSHTGLASARDTNTESIFNYEVAKVNYYRSLGDFTDYFRLEKGEKL